MTAFGAPLGALSFDFAGLVPIGRRSGAGARAASRPGTSVTIPAVESAHRGDDRSDESLMLDFLDGSRAAFETLVARYSGELHTFLFRFLNSSASADDVLQETFLQLYQSGRTFDPSRRFRPWLFTIAANKARDWHRRHRSRGQVSLDAPVGPADSRATVVDLLAGDDERPGAPLERSEEARVVKEVVDGMPRALREILLLSYFQRMSYAQVAEALDIPLGTVKSRLHAAVAAFADRWRTRRGATPSDTLPSLEAENDS